MGWEDNEDDSDKDKKKDTSQSSETVQPVRTRSQSRARWEDEREFPASYPRQEGEHDLEMRNLAMPESQAKTQRQASTRPLGEEVSMQRTRSPVDGLRRRLSRDPAVKEDVKKEEERHKNQREVPVAVVEQRLSNLAQGCLCKSPLIKCTKED
jgi:hypothetical protein